MTRADHSPGAPLNASSADALNERADKILPRIPRFYWLATLLLLAIGIWSATSDTLLAKQGGDGQIDYLPSRVFSAEMFRAGALPLWDPHIFSGMSHVAIVQTAPFYPLNIILYVLLPSTVAFNVAMVLHVLLLLGFSHAYFRLLTARDEAAWLGGVAFTFSGFLLLHLEATGMFNSAAWIAPLFYCVEKWIRTRQWRFCAWGGVCLAFQLLAGWPQMVLLSAIYVAIYFLCALRQQPRRIQLVAGLLLMGVLSAGLGGIELLPTMEFKPYSNLAVLTYSHFLSNSVAPQTFVTLLFPYLLGADYVTHHAVPWLGPAQMAVTASYMGILPLMLGVAALAFWRTSRQVRFAACSSILAAFLACVGFTPLAPLLYRLPVYNFFRDHRVNLIFLAFSVATLTTCLAGHLHELSPALRRRLARAVPLGVFISGVFLLIWIRAIVGSTNQHIAPLHPQWLWRLHQSMHFGNHDMIIAWGTILLAGVLFWKWMKQPESTVIARLAIIFVLADLLWFGLTDQPHFSRGHANAAEQTIIERARSAAAGQPFRTMSLVRDGAFISPNLNEIAGVDDIYGYSALVPRQYADLLPVSVFEQPHWRELMANNTVLSLLNTRFLFASGEEAKQMESMFGGPTPAATFDGREGTSAQNILNPEGWSALKSGERLDVSNPFRCSDPPCGMQQGGLALQRNSVYELRFTVAVGNQVSDLNVVIARHNWWQPLRSYTAANVQISRKPTPYTNIYVTGPEDEFIDLRFSTSEPVPVHVSEVSLARVGGLPSGHYHELANRDGIFLVENLNALPRAFFVSQVARVADYQEARNRLWDPIDTFDPRREALVEGTGNEEVLGAGSVGKIDYSPNRVHLNLTCPSRCFLVLTDLYLPGWQATIDGSATPIYRTDAVLRGIFVTAGIHHVEFRYRPKSIVFGLWSMLISIVVIVFLTGHPHHTPCGTVEPQRRADTAAL